MVGRVIGWGLLGLLALVLVLLLVPAAVYLEYDGGVFSLKVRVLFVKVGVLPPPARRARTGRRGKRRAVKEKKQKAAVPDAEKPKRTLEELLRFARRIATAGSRGLRFVLRFLRVRDVRVVIPVSGGEAADVATGCGKMQALLGSVRGVLGNLLRVDYKQLEVLPDFAGQYGGRLHLSCKVSASPVIMVVAGILGLKEFLLFKPVAYSKMDYLRAHPDVWREARRQAEAGKTG